MGTRIIWAALALAVAQPVAAREPLPLTERVAATLRVPGPGTRFGLLVTTEDGREIVAIAPDDRFVPASNTKLFTTAAAFDTIGDLTQPDVAGGATVHLDGKDVVLTGYGDARMSSADDCTVDCLATLADAVAKATKRVRHVIGDATHFPDERWSPGMSWNNIQTRSGTGIAALVVDDNETMAQVTPGSGGRVSVAANGYFAIENVAATVASGKTALAVSRMPGTRAIRLSGTILATAPPETIRFGIDDPAHFAAWRLRKLLEARGVKVSGEVRVRYRPLVPQDDPAFVPQIVIAAPQPPVPLARLLPAPLVEDMGVINKVSQNLHAELALRRVGRVRGQGAIVAGQAAVIDMLTRAGVPRWAYDLSDGSGMSSYNRLTPRATVTLLQWAARQPWGAAWRTTLPIGGVDGTLRRRFVGTPLAGKVFAKTGSLNQASGLSGYMTAASGRTLVFSSFAADMPSDVSITGAVDTALALIAAEN